MILFKTFTLDIFDVENFTISGTLDAASTNLAKSRALEISAIKPVGSVNFVLHILRFLLLIHGATKASNPGKVLPKAKAAYFQTT